MKSKAIQFLEANQSGDRSTFVDDAKWRQENETWLRRVKTDFGARLSHKNAFVQRGKSMGEKPFISPKSLLNSSRHLSHDSQAA
jgi:hypothetical protein